MMGDDVTSVRPDPDAPGDTPASEPPGGKYVEPAPPAGEPGDGPPPDAEDAALADALLEVWAHPRRTIRRIVARDPRYLVVPLAALGGIAQAFATMANRGGGERLSLAGVLVVALLGGPLLGVVGLYVGGWLVALTGRWLQGVATVREVRAALAWASLPESVALPLWLLATAALGRALYDQTTADLVAGGGLYALFVIAVSALRLTEIVLGANTVAEVQGYRSVWMGVLNLLLAGLTFAAAAVVIGVAIFLVGGGLAWLR
jgi:hypothetical protein